MGAEYENFLNRIKKETSVVIFGAGKFAKTLCRFLDRNSIKVDAFAVTRLGENRQKLLGRPVISLDEFREQMMGKSLVVGREQRRDTKQDVCYLLDRRIEKILMVPHEAVNDIYCNMILDGSGIDSLCNGLKNEQSITAVVNDMTGVKIVQYLELKGIRIGSVWTQCEELPIGEEIAVRQYDQILGMEKDTTRTVLLTMDSTDWQRGYVTGLRNQGIERIILLSRDILDFIKDDYRRCIWKKSDGSCKIAVSGNVERYHYLVETEYGPDLYRWRIKDSGSISYPELIVKSIQDGGIWKEYMAQFPHCAFLPYEEVSLYDVQRPDISLEVYMAEFHMDRKIKQPVLPDWILPIQVGRALTDIRVARITDNTGDNISCKNVDYSEATALYWMWKNTGGQDYIGLFHYRRQMAMGKDTLERLQQYDMLLTVPTFNLVKNKEFFCEHFILEKDWALMMEYIKEYDGAYYETALRYEASHFLFPCNIFIMRRAYFDAVCTFIFGVLEKVEGYYRDLKMVREDRYLGYLVENLLSIYIMHHADTGKAAYTDMKYYYFDDEIH